MGQLNTFVPVYNVDGTLSLLLPLILETAVTGDIYVSLGVNPSTGPALNIGYGGASFGRGAGFINVRPDGSAVAPNPSLRFLVANVERLRIDNLGNIEAAATYSPTGAKHLVTRDYTDGAVPLWLPAMSIADVTVNPRGWLSNQVYQISLPNAATSTIGGTFHVPAKLLGRNFTLRLIYSSEVAGNNFEVSFTNHEWAAGFDADQINAATTLTVPGPAAASFGQYTTALRSSFAITKPFLNVVVTRNGSAAADTSTGALQVIGMTLEVV